jgi:hypothetical protein
MEHLSLSYCVRDGFLSSFIGLDRVCSLRYAGWNARQYWYANFVSIMNGQWEGQEFSGRVYFLDVCIRFHIIV